MNSNMTKFLSIAAVALFCVSAFGAIFAADDSDAASKNTYNVYVEVIGDDGIMTASGWVWFEAEDTMDAFATEGTKALKAAGFSKMSFSVDPTYGISVGYTDGFGSACYYAKDGAWTAVADGTQDYVPNTTLGFAVNYGYIPEATYTALPADEKAKWSETGIGFGYDYMKILDAKTTDVPATKEYNVFVDIIDAAGKTVQTKWVSFESYKTSRGFVEGINLFMPENGLEKVGAKYNDSNGRVSATYDGAGSNRCYYENEGKWAAIEKSEEDYIKGNAVAFGLDHGWITTAVYNALSDSEQQGWEESGFGDPYAYYVLIDEPTDGYKSEEKNNTALYIGIGVAAVVVIAILAFVFLRKK